MQQYFIDLAGGLLYGLVGLVLMVVGYYVIDLLTPGHFGRLLHEERSPNAAMVAAAGLLAMGLVVTSAVYAADGELRTGLAEAGGYGVVGVVLIGVAFKLVDLVTPGNLGETVTSTRPEPLSVVVSAFLLSIGGILAAAIA